MNLKKMTTSACALTLFAGCQVQPGLIAELLGTQPVPASTPSARPTPRSSAAPTAWPEPSTRPVSTTDLLLYVNMDARPVDYTYQGTPTESKGVTAAMSGYHGAAWHFDGQESFLKIPLNINAEKYPALTMTAWVRYEGGDVSGPLQVVSHDDGGYDRSMGIDKRGENSGRWSWSTFAGSGEVMASGIPVEKGQWIFLATVYDQQAQTVTFYVNNSAKSGLTSAIDSRTQLGGASLGTGHPYLWLGGNPSYGEHFTGLIDEVRIYGRALSETEIKQLHDSAEG